MTEPTSVFAKVGMRLAKKNPNIGLINALIGDSLTLRAHHATQALAAVIPAGADLAVHREVQRRANIMGGISAAESVYDDLTFGRWTP